jgi:pantoate kinase
MTAKKKKTIIKIPHRLTGFFEIINTKNGDRLENPEEIGSRGAGISLSAMGKTSITSEHLEGIKEPVCDIFINGEQLNEQAETTNYIFEYVKNMINEPIKIRISHEFELPVGCGYGASGSGALGTIFGLNNLLNLKLSEFECGKIAHISEVINQTGLGTICGLLCSGLCALKEGGYPCNFEKIAVPKDIRVICTSFGEIPTKSILSDPHFDSKIKAVGGAVLKKFIKNPNIYTFLKYSREFTDKTQMLDLLDLDKTKNLINTLNKEDIIGASMNQLGRSAFAVAKKRDIKDVLEIFKSYQATEKIFILKIYEKNPQCK